MLNNVLRKCSSSFLNSQTTVTFSPRLFSQSSYLDQKHNVNKKIVKFKKHHKPKPKKNPPEPEKPRSELTEKYQSYVENLILATHDELASIKERERLLAASLPDDILEVRSHVTCLLICHLYICSCVAWPSPTSGWTWSTRAGLKAASRRSVWGLSGQTPTTLCPAGAGGGSLPCIL